MTGMGKRRGICFPSLDDLQVTRFLDHRSQLSGALYFLYHVSITYSKQDPQSGRCHSHLPCPTRYTTACKLSPFSCSEEPAATPQISLPVGPQILSVSCLSPELPRPTCPSSGSCSAQRLFTSPGTATAWGWCAVPLSLETPLSMRERFKEGAKGGTEGNGWRITPRALGTCNRPLLPHGFVALCCVWGHCGCVP